MIETGSAFTPILVLMGVVVVLSVPLRAILGKGSLPGMVGFIAMGILLALADPDGDLMTPMLRDGIHMLAELGIVALLFRVGLESDLDQLVGQLRRAVGIWVFDLAVPATIVFVLILAWPGLGLIPAVLVGIASSATSVGVSVAVWQEAGLVGTQKSALLLDVAELDDLSAVVLLGIVFALLAEADGGRVGWVAADVARVGGLQLIRIVLFCAACYAFSRYFEQRLSSIFKSMDAQVGPFIFAAGSVFLIAALSEWLGLSIAIGALFAGLAFSRDPEEQQMDVAFAYVLALFGPFFFLSIGMSVSFDDFGAALILTVALGIALVLGKLLGAGLATWAVTDRRTGLLIGASMIPRAEIYLILMLHGLTLGPWAIPPTLYSAAVLASVATCIIGPLMVARLLVPERQGRQSA